MKKFIYGALLSAGCLVLATSCANEDVVNPALEGDTAVNLNIQLPDGIDTRTFGDGQSATQLYYTIYQLDGENYTRIGTAPLTATFDNLRTNVTLKLVNGSSYAILFWAQNPDCTAYTVNWDSRQLSVNYENLTPNTENSDAFYNLYNTGVIKAPLSRTIYLKRPLAQINWGTDDSTEPTVTTAFGENLANAQTALTVTNVYENFDFASGDVTGSPTDVTFPATAVPSATAAGNFPVTGYQYLSMDYVLAPKDKSLSDLTFTVTANGKTFNTISVPGAPVQLNYRTNIYGQLLTSDNNYTVVINPAFNRPDYNVWDGKSATVPAITTDSQGNQKVDISTPDQLAGLAELVKTNKLTGIPVNLNADFEMTAGAFPSIGTSSQPFEGTLNGKNHTIKTTTNSIFGHVNNAEVKDLTVENTGARYSALVQTANGNTSLSGITVKGDVKLSSAFSHLGTAGLVSKVAENASLTIDNCSNYADITDTGYCAGGMVGRTETGSSVTITNSTNYGNVTCTRSNGPKSAGFIAMPVANVSMSNCTNKGEITASCTNGGAAIGGLIGWYGNELKLDQCTNNGNVTLTFNGTSNTGIVLAGGLWGGSGWNNYYKEITGCTNNGNVKIVANNIAANDTNYAHGLYAGGINAYADYDATYTMTGCTNKGSITVEQGANRLNAYVGGLVGAFGWESAITLTGNTVDAACVLTGGTYTAALCNLISGTNKNVNISENTNSTTYPDQTGN